MENASKALLMAGAVLVGVMILSLAAYLFSIFGGTSAEINNKITEKQKLEFNAQFTKYEGKTDLRAQDVVSIANLAKSSNDKYNYSNINYITVTVNRIETQFERKNFEQEKKIEEFIKIYSLKTDNVTPYTFECKEVEISNITRLVKKVTISLNS